jgi:deoxyribodipyrimidine photo-lyase
MGVKTTKPKVRIVWFKKDLRLADHRPLLRACERGQVIPLFLFEPSILSAPDTDAIHIQFQRESLADLRTQIQERGGNLLIRVGEAVEVFQDLSRKYEIEEICAHEETGNAITFARDLAVHQWCRANRISFTEWPTNGVVRRLRSRDGWARNWEQRMAEPVALIPDRIDTPLIDSTPIPTLKELGFYSVRTVEQRGGELAAQCVLDDFLYRRGVRFLGGISSPITAFEAGSRLSPYLAFGNLSSRQVVQATRARIAQLDPNDPKTTRWKRSLRGFDERLHWRCHFVQKLESEPAIENHNFVRALDGLREDSIDPRLLQAWCTGRTGYPMIDACMRCLQETGWLNFRMRAMLASVAAYQLWLHWKPTALFTARAWLDYEPGIHYSQFQMQSGTTGINTLRIYNPIKQSQDHDPDGEFLRRWVPELAGVSATWIHTPWLMPDELQVSSGVRIGRDYPPPVVDHLAAVAEAKRKIAAHRASRADYWSEVRGVTEKHGSRRRPMERPKPPKGARSAGKKPTDQPSLEF